MREKENICVGARIHGRVQGVFYRAWTEKTARSLGLAGWVRNRRDGTVEALFRGPREAVEEMLKRAYDGPPAARVARIEVREEAEEEVENEASGPDADGFHVLPTV